MTTTEEFKIYTEDELSKFTKQSILITKGNDKETGKFPFYRDFIEI
jgi:hypothetical protein